jgi:hypothetical protein
MSDDLFRSPFVLQVIRATLVSKGIPGERLEEAIEKVVRACIERVRRSGRPPADVGQATAIALTIANAAGRARPRPEAGAATTQPPPAPESGGSPPATHAGKTTEEPPKPQDQAPRSRRAAVALITAGVVAALAGATVLYLGSPRPRSVEGSALGANATTEGNASAEPLVDARAQATAHEAIVADTPEAAVEGGAEGLDAAESTPSSVPDSARETGSASTRHDETPETHFVE